MYRSAGATLTAISVSGPAARVSLDAADRIAPILQRVAAELGAAVITGEGSLDGQSLNGKAPVGVCLRASRRNIPTHAIVGVLRLSRQEMRGSGVCVHLCASGSRAGCAPVDGARGRPDRLGRRESRH